MPRAKPRAPLPAALTYRFLRLLRRVLGTERALRAALNCHWILKRTAWELAGEHFAEAFHRNSVALSEELVAAWVPAGSRVIDVGCGSGRWCRVVSSRAAEVLGVDYDERSIESARSLSAGYENVRYRIGDVTQDLAEARFDVALLVHVLEHIEDPVALLRCLEATAARLVIEVPDFDSDALNPVRQALGCPFYTDSDHVREYTASLLEEHLRAGGWQIRDQRSRKGALLVLADRRQSTPAG